MTDSGGSYNGQPWAASATVAGVDGIVRGSLEGVTPTILYYVGTTASGTGAAAAPIQAGTYTAQATFAGSTDYTSASDSVIFTIARVAPRVSVSDAGGAYNGSPFPATATVTGLSGMARASLEGVAPTLLYYVGAIASGNSSSVAPTAGGTYTVVATFTGSTDYNTANSSTTFVIALNQATVSVVDVGGVYTGSALPATALVAGTNGQFNPTLEGVAPTLLYYAGSTASGTASSTAPSTAGTYTVLATFSGTADYASASNSATFNITQAMPAVQVSDGGTYSGIPLPATATATGVSGVAGASLEGVAPTLLYYVGSSASGASSTAAPTTVGTYTVVATFAGSTDYSSASNSATFSITTATPSVHVSDAGGYFTGNPIPATATVTGVSGVPGASLEGVTPSVLYYVGPTASGAGSQTAPSAIGTYTVVASFAGSTDYTNASNSTIFSINPLTFPALQVANLAVSPTASLSGGQVTVTWNDMNSGNGNLNQSFNDHVKVVNTATGQTLVDSDDFYDVTQPGGVIPIGGSSSQRHYAFTLPDGDPGVGTLQITVTTDYDNLFLTSASGHSASITTTSTLGNYPDLQVSRAGGEPGGAPDRRPGDRHLVRQEQRSWSRHAILLRPCQGRQHLDRPDTGR